MLVQVDTSAIVTVILDIELIIAFISMAARGRKVEEGGDVVQRKEKRTEVVATRDHVAHCYDALVASFRGQAPPKEPFDTNGEHPLFVTWKKYDSRRRHLSLRGCIGNLSPIPLTRIKEYALISALKDRRFDPMNPRELRDTHCGVSILVKYEKGKSWNDFEIGKHGMIIDFGFEDGSQYSATYLPEVAKEQGWNHQETIDTLIRKSGYKGRINNHLREAISLTRYQSSKAALSYDEWFAMRGLTEHPF